MRRNMPPKKALERHIDQVRQLIRGEAIGFPWEAKGWYVCALIAWREEDKPDIDTIRVLNCPGTRKNLVFAALNDSPDIHEDDYETVQSKVISMIKRRPEFKKFSQRIKSLCKQADGWKKYEDFEWFSDVLAKAELPEGVDDED